MPGAITRLTGQTVERDNRSAMRLGEMIQREIQKPWIAKKI